MQLLMRRYKQLPIRCNPSPVPDKQCNRRWFLKKVLMKQQPSRVDSIALKNKKLQPHMPSVLKGA